MDVFVQSRVNSECGSKIKNRKAFANPEMGMDYLNFRFWENSGNPFSSCNVDLSTSIKLCLLKGACRTNSLNFHLDVSLCALESIAVESVFAQFHEIKRKIIDGFAKDSLYGLRERLYDTRLLIYSDAVEKGQGEDGFGNALGDGEG